MTKSEAVKNEKNTKIFLKIVKIVAIIAAALILIGVVIPYCLCEYKGEVSGTNYIYQEYPRRSLDFYGVSPSGDIYVPARLPNIFSDGVNIYDGDGNYKYTLDCTAVNVSFFDAARFDENGNLLLYYSKGDRVSVFDSKGYLIDKIYSDEKDFPETDFESIAEQTVNGQTYLYESGTIYKIDKSGNKNAIITASSWEGISGFCYSNCVFWPVFTVLLSGFILFYPGIKSSKTVKKEH